MIGSFLTRGLVMVFGYAYPAYECYKTVEKNKPEIEQLRFWCQYWILVAVLTVSERIGDAFISWVPMYSEAKLAFFIYLWYPKTKGTSYVYDSFFRPYVSRHENEIDRNLLELRTRAGDMAVLYWQRAASYGQTRVFDILQYIASQSTPRPRPAQPQPNARGQGPAPASNRQPAAAAQPETEEPPSPTSSTSSSQYQKEVLEEVDPLPVPEASPRAKSSSLQRANSTSSNLQRTNSTASNAQKANSTASNAQKAISTPSNAQKATFAASNAQKANSASETSSQSMPNEPEAMQVEVLSNENDANPPPKETVMEETIRVTRGRLRKNRSGSNQ
ncbi:hypothetical protein ACOSP7_011115 [Xanthoceras sorbifolium]|uniref:HVA22-like protein n=1 Tax=Xanthoceras sorbifolium TaxID=99658 RepID=A0ABQ8HS81_9ROSI|nr:hypothetical protein JRO89_XS07G0023300 [Xanthoceras sorbifolium]